MADSAMLGTLVVGIEADPTSLTTALDKTEKVAAAKAKKIRR